MNRAFLEQLMYFLRQSENAVDSLEEELKNQQSICEHCGLSPADNLAAEIAASKTTVAYLKTLLDTYWSSHKE